MLSAEETEEEKAKKKLKIKARDEFFTAIKLEGNNEKLCLHY